MSKTNPPWLESGWQHIWPPYTQVQIADVPLPVRRAYDRTIVLEDGRELLDGIASWWSVCHGYQHPQLVEAIQQQVAELSHVMFAGLAHEPAYVLAEKLVRITPDGLNRVFFSESGSVAVEVAMKMAVQYWINHGQPRRTKFICFKNSYHGDTLGAMSLADPEHGMHTIFHDYVPRQYVLDIPRDEYSLDEFRDVMESGIDDTVAGLIIEPLVQGAGGMKFYSADVLEEIYRVCKANNILFIADEIMTGFGRTGTMFACEQAGITPDIMCVGKALTGGMISLAATLATDKVFEAFLGESLQQALMHGPTYMANPLACAAANASLDLFENEPRLEQIAAIESWLYEHWQAFKTHDKVKDVRVLGAIGVIQLRDVDWDSMFAMRKAFVEHGVWLRPFLDMIYVMPSFTMTEDELSKITKAIETVLENI